MSGRILSYFQKYEIRHCIGTYEYVYICLCTLSSYLYENTPILDTMQSRIQTASYLVVLLGDVSLWTLCEGLGISHHEDWTQHHFCVVLVQLVVQVRVNVTFGVVTYINMHRWFSIRSRIGLRLGPQISSCKTSDERWFIYPIINCFHEQRKAEQSKAKQDSEHWS